jgi:hypothetical protein
MVLASSVLSSSAAGEVDVICVSLPFRATCERSV